MDKKLARIYSTLVDVQALHCLEIERPNSVLKLREDSTEKYSETFEWQIRAAGRLEDARIDAIGDNRDPYLAVLRKI